MKAKVLLILKPLQIDSSCGLTNNWKGSIRHLKLTFLCLVCCFGKPVFLILLIIIEQTIQVCSVTHINLSSTVFLVSSIVLLVLFEFTYPYKFPYLICIDSKIVCVHTNDDQSTE